MANSRDEVEKQLIKSFKELVMTTPVDKIRLRLKRLQTGRA